MSSLEHKDIDFKSIEAGKNEFSYTLENTGTLLTYQLITGKIEKVNRKRNCWIKKITIRISTGLRQIKTHDYISGW